MPIYRIPKPVLPSVPAIKEAVSQPRPVAPNPVTNRTIPNNVIDALAKTPTALALQRFPKVSGGFTADAQRTGLGVLNTPASRDNFDRLTKQAAVDQLKQADLLAEDAMGLVGARNPSLADQARAKFEMAEASQIRKSVADRLAALDPNAPGLAGVGEGALLQAEILKADNVEQKAFSKLYRAGTSDETAIAEGVNDWKAAVDTFHLIETDITTDEAGSDIPAPADLP